MGMRKVEMEARDSCKFALRVPAYLLCEYLPCVMNVSAYPL